MDQFALVDESQKKIHWVYRSYGSQIQKCPEICPRCGLVRIGDPDRQGNVVLKGNNVQRYDPFELLYKLQIPICTGCYTILHRSVEQFLTVCGLMSRITELIQANYQLPATNSGFGVKLSSKKTKKLPPPTLVQAPVTNKSVPATTRIEETSQSKFFFPTPPFLCFFFERELVN